MRRSHSYMRDAVGPRVSLCLSARFSAKDLGVPMVKGTCMRKGDLDRTHTQTHARADAGVAQPRHGQQKRPYIYHRPIDGVIKVTSIVRLYPGEKELRARASAGGILRTRSVLSLRNK